MNTAEAIIHPALDEQTICDRWAAWCAANKIELASMDEVEAMSLTPAQRQEVKAFIRDWEAMETYFQFHPEMKREQKAYWNLDALADALHGRVGVAMVEEALRGTGYIFDATCPTGSLGVLRRDSVRCVYLTPGWEGLPGVQVQVDQDGVHLNEEESGLYALPALTVEAYIALMMKVLRSVEKSGGKRSDLV